MFSIRVLHRIFVQYHDFRGVYTWRKLLVVDFRRLQADYSELMAVMTYSWDGILITPGIGMRK